MLAAVVAIRRVLMQLAPVRQAAAQPLAEPRDRRQAAGPRKGA
jgi:hypothetical protein